ncbi:MAG: hypothetical protein HYZ23_09655 [Chloroflexi bacterium]|nr:hypothetical protein [Chloroflexota bacterium]
MSHILLLLSLVLFLQSTDVVITYPQPGDILRGQVEVTGGMDVPGFVSAELTFSFASDSADNGFVIQTFSQPVPDSVIAVWDTTLITDGAYALRLRVFLQDGSIQEAVVSNLTIQNDEPTPTATLAVTSTPEIFNTASPPTLTPRPVPTLQTFPSPTPLPANPATVTSSSIYATFARGALIVSALFIIFSFILRLRKS